MTLPRSLDVFRFSAISRWDFWFRKELLREVLIPWRRFYVVMLDCLGWQEMNFSSSLPLSKVADFYSAGMVLNDLRSS